MSQERITKTINIQANLHKELKVIAAREGKSVQKLVEEVLREALGVSE